MAGSIMTAPPLALTDAGQPPTKRRRLSHAPRLHNTIQTWYRQPTNMRWDDCNGETRHYATRQGVPQGCALSAAAYAITTADINENIVTDINQLIDQHNTTNPPTTHQATSHPSSQPANQSTEAFSPCFQAVNVLAG